MKKITKDQKAFSLKDNLEEISGTILGTYKNKIVALANDTYLNRNICIYGGPGSGKSRYFSLSLICQCIKRGESICVTDPKGEIYSYTYEYLKEHGYDVKIFNTKQPSYSDAWNCLGEISKDDIEQMAQIFADVIIKSISDPLQRGNKFEQGTIALLKALCLYVITDTNEENKTLGKVYEMLVNNSEAVLTQMFDALDMSHPARVPWRIYKSFNNELRDNIKCWLEMCLARAMGSPLIRKITGYDEIDMDSLGTTKSAFFIITSDQDNVMGFLSTLFFTFLFIDLVRYADGPGHGSLPIPVNMILDEFPNIGQIPDFTKKISTVRSRKINIAVIFQNLAQLQNRYPNGLWEEIIASCDTQLFMGCTDPLTAKYVSEQINVKRKQFLMKPDEILQLSWKDAFIITKEHQPLKVQKFDVFKNSEFLDSFKFRVRDHVPQWKKKEELD